MKHPVRIQERLDNCPRSPECERTNFVNCGCARLDGERAAREVLAMLAAEAALKAGRAS